MARGIGAKSLAGIGSGGPSIGAPAFILHKNLTGIAADGDVAIIEDTEFSFRVIDCWAVANANMTASETLAIKDQADNVVVTAFAIGGGSDELADVFRAAEIDDAHCDIAEGEDLKVSVDYNSVTVEADLYVMCVRT